MLPLSLNFPKYIPDVIKNQVNHYFYGTKHLVTTGWINTLQELENKISVYKDTFNLSDHDRHELLELNNRYTVLLNDIDCINRLIFDSRMNEVYATLENKLNDDELDTFFQIVWSSNINYRELKDEENTAKQILSDIIKTAKKLASLLGKAEESGVTLPSELFSIQTLLENTGSSDPLWDGLRDTTLLNQNYTWMCSPSVRQMIEALSYSKGVSINDNGFNHAISKRQFNTKMSYLRSVIVRLIDNSIRVDTPEFKTALGGIATIVLNEKDTIIDRQDVQNALKSIK